MSEELGAGKRWLAKLATLSKGIGTCGGFVAGSKALADFLVQRAAATFTARPSLRQWSRLVRRHCHHACAHRPTRAFASTQPSRTQLASKPRLASPRGRTPIIPVIVGSSERALGLSAQLATAGCYVPAIRPPTVPQMARLPHQPLSRAHRRSDPTVARCTPGGLSNTNRITSGRQFSEHHRISP